MFHDNYVRTEFTNKTQIWIQTQTQRTMIHIGEILGPLLQSPDNIRSYAACLHAQIYDMRMRARNQHTQPQKHHSKNVRNEACCWSYYRKTGYINKRVYSMDHRGNTFSHRHG